MRKSNLILALALGIVLLGSAAPTNAASLWLNGNDLYSSHGAARNYQPGDIITIKISETTSAQSKATTKTEKETKTEATAQPRIPIFKRVMNKIVGEQKISNEFDGEGTTTRSSGLEGTITATVLEILPLEDNLCKVVISVPWNRAGSFQDYVIYIKKGDLLQTRTSSQIAIGVVSDFQYNQLSFLGVAQ